MWVGCMEYPVSRLACTLAVFLAYFVSRRSPFRLVCIYRLHVYCCIVTPDGVYFYCHFCRMLFVEGEKWL